MKLQNVYHMGIPVNNLDRAKDFYANVLGMEYLGRVGGNPNNPDSFPVHGVAQKLDRFRCGNDDVVLFERPRPIERDASTAAIRCKGCTAEARRLLCVAPPISRPNRDSLGCPFELWFNLGSHS